MIHLLWPTVRPEVMKSTYQHWLDMAHNSAEVTVHIAVNTLEQAELLQEFEDVYVCGDKIKGVAFPSYVLSTNLKAAPNDIIILASDDFFAPKNWDSYLKKAFKRFNGCLLVNDGYQYGNCVTIPIMTMDCLEKINRIIYHPVYRHLWSDNELYINLRNMKLLKDRRRGDKQSPLFEHRHYDAKKRPRDKHDRLAHSSSSEAKALKTYNTRMKKPIKTRLVVGKGWRKLVANAKRV